MMVTERLCEDAIAQVFARFKELNPAMNEEFLLSSAQAAVYDSYELALAEPPPTPIQSPLLNNTRLSPKLREHLRQNQEQTNKILRETHEANLARLFTLSGVSQETALEIVRTDILKA